MALKAATVEKAPGYVLPIFVELFRGGQQVVRLSPLLAMTPEDIDPILKTAAAAFEADMVGVIYETIMVATPDFRVSTVHPITRAPLTLAALQALVEVAGPTSGLMHEAIIAAGANRAGDFRVRIDWYDQFHDGRLRWRQAPEVADQEAEYGDSAMVTGLREAMEAETMRQSFAQLMGQDVVAPEEDLPQERIDVLTAMWLTRSTACRVQLIGQDERARQLRRWAEEDWQWHEEGLLPEAPD
jgi:hypothetical protein